MSRAGGQAGQGGRGRRARDFTKPCPYGGRASVHAVECCHLSSGANLPWCGALCVHRSGVPNHLQESLTSRKRLGQAKAKTTGGLGTALAKLKENLTCVAFLLSLSPSGKASTAPACLPRLTRVACLSTSSSSHCRTWYFGIDTRTRLPKLSPT